MDNSESKLALLVTGLIGLSEKPRLLVVDFYLHQNFLCPYLYFKSACLSNINSVLLPLIYPIAPAILILNENKTEEK